MPNNAFWKYVALTFTVPIINVCCDVWPYQSYKSVPYHPPSMNITKTGETAPGLLFFGPTTDPLLNDQMQQSALIMTDTNDLVWQGPMGYTTGLSVQTVRGEQYLTVWNGTAQADSGLGYGEILFFDRTYTEKYRVQLSGEHLVQPRNGTFTSYIDLHEDFVTDRGTILVVVKNVTTADLTSVGGPVNGWVLDNMFYEVDIASNNVVFQWSAIEHLAQVPFTASKFPLNITVGGHFIQQGIHQAIPWDWFELNSVATVGDGYLVSFHHAWTTLWLDSQGNIVHQLEGTTGGDFTLDPGVSFKWQHDIRAVDVQPSGQTINMHSNNGYITIPNPEPATGLSLHVNFTTRTVSLLQKFIDPTDLIYSLGEGSYQALPNGHVLLGHGQTAKMKEYDAQGRCVYTAQFGAVNQAASYRAYRVADWVGVPAQPPATYFEAAPGGQMDVYASWNGATDYEGWVLFAGNGSETLRWRGFFARTGFETKMTVAAATHVRVQPVGKGFRGREWETRRTGCGGGW